MKRRRRRRRRDLKKKEKKPVDLSYCEYFRVGRAVIHTPLAQVCLLPSLGIITRLDRDHILASQSALAIVSGLHKVAMGVWSTQKLYQSWAYFQTVLKQKSSRVLLTSCNLLLV